MDSSISRSGPLLLTFCGFLPLLFCGSPHSRAAAPPPPAQVPGGSRRVILVHGIYTKFMGNVKHVLESHGWQVYAVRLNPADASVPFDVMARQLDAFVSANIPDGGKFDLVGFSMGGLVCRYYIQKMGGYRRVRRFVTLSTPNHGTIWAWLSRRSGVRQMRPGSSMLRDLNGDLGKLARLDYTSIYTPLDLTIMPSVSSRMPGAHNVITWVPLHPLMVWMPSPIRALEQALSAPSIPHPR